MGGGKPGTDVKGANSAGQQNSTDVCDPSNPHCKTSKESKKPKIGVVLQVYPRLFSKKEYPKGIKDFTLLKGASKKLFKQKLPTGKFSKDKYCLLPDGLQEAVIAIRIVDVDASSPKSLGFTSYGGGGKLIIKSSNADIGSFTNKGANYDLLKDNILLADIGKGKDGYEELVFKVKDKLGTTNISFDIQEMDPAYEFVKNFVIPEDEDWEASLTIQTRELKMGDPKNAVANDAGYDVMKLQWYLRSFGYYKKDKTGADADIDGDFGPDCERAVRRLQRRAKGPYRNKQGKQPDTNGGYDAKPVDFFTGNSDGKADQQTIAEVMKWHNNQWYVPLGRLGLSSIALDTRHIKLRSDAAKFYEAIRQEIYDTNGGKISDGASSERTFDAVVTSARSPVSMHYCYLAIDLAQDYKTSAYPSRDVSKGTSSKEFWTLWTLGTKGTAKKIAKHTEKYYNWLEGRYPKPDSKGITPTKKNGIDVFIPEGTYFNLTNVFKNHNFTPIPPHDNYETATHVVTENGVKKVKDYDQAQEWWHFQYDLPVPSYFQDEVELVDKKYDEKYLKDHKLTNKELERYPS